MVLERMLVYYKLVIILLVFEFGMCFSCNFDFFCLLDQNSLYIIWFDVIEIYQGVFCDVIEGYIVVNNVVVKENSCDILFYLFEMGDFEQYSFVGGVFNFVFFF